jgi:hypothetical protein
VAGYRFRAEAETGTDAPYCFFDYLVALPDGSNTGDERSPVRGGW